MCASVRDPLRVRGGEPVTAMTACGAYSMYYGIVFLFPIAASRSMCKYYTVIRFILCIIYYIYPGAVVVRKPRKEANFRLARPAAYRSITEFGAWPSKPVMGHATQSGGINQVAGDAATATAIPNLKSVSDRSHEGRRTIAGD